MSLDYLVELFFEVDQTVGVNVASVHTDRQVVPLKQFEVVFFVLKHILTFANLLNPKFFERALVFDALAYRQVDLISQFSSSWSSVTWPVTVGTQDQSVVVRVGSVAIFVVFTSLLIDSSQGRTIVALITPTWSVTTLSNNRGDLNYLRESLVNRSCAAVNLRPTVTVHTQVRGVFKNWPHLIGQTFHLIRQTLQRRIDVRDLSIHVVYRYTATYVFKRWTIL